MAEYTKLELWLFWLIRILIINTFIGFVKIIYSSPFYFL